MDRVTLVGEKGFQHESVKEISILLTNFISFLSFFSYHIFSYVGCRTPISDTHNKEFGVPTLEDLGVCMTDLGPNLYPGGETEALERMERHLKKVVKKLHDLNFVRCVVPNREKRKRKQK